MDQELLQQVADLQSSLEASKALNSRLLEEREGLLQERDALLAAKHEVVLETSQDRVNGSKAIIDHITSTLEGRSLDILNTTTLDQSESLVKVVSTYQMLLDKEQAEGKQAREEVVELKRLHSEALEQIEELVKGGFSLSKSSRYVCWFYLLYSLLWVGKKSYLSIVWYWRVS